VKPRKTGYDELERRVLRAFVKFVRAVAIAAALILLAWSIAIPNFPCHGINANESAAIATLKNIHSAQVLFRDRLAVDRDADAKGEFGWLDELAGAATLRGGLAERRLDPPVLSRAFGEVQLGNVKRSGYLFCMWLPAVGGGWARECDGVPIDTDAAETQFCIYAWPTMEADHSKRVFFLGAAGDVFASRNTPDYRGTERPAPIDAALPSSDASSERGDWGHVGRDGDRWVIIL